MFRYINIVLLCGFVLVIVSCGQATKPPFECKDKMGCVTIRPNQPIKIGVLQDLSGAAKLPGSLHTNVIELTVSEKGNQLLGHSVELVNEDEKCTYEGGANAILKYTADPQIVAILGPTCSSAVIAGTNALAESGLVMISPQATSPALTSIGGKKGSNWQEGFFRTMINGSGQGITTAKFAFEKMGLRKMGTIDDGDAFSVGIAQSFAQAFTELGGKVTSVSSINRGDSDMQPVLTTMEKAQVEGVFMPVLKQDALAIYQQTSQMEGAKKMVFFANNSLLDADLFKELNDESPALYIVLASNITTPATNDLLKRYTDKYGKTTSPNYRFSYDAVNLLFAVLEQVAIKDDDGTLHIGRHALREALYNTKDFAGVAGKFSCDKFGDCGIGSHDILQVKNSDKSTDEIKANIMYTYDPEQK